MHLREGEYEKAHTDFFEAFKNYDESGSQRYCTQSHFHHSHNRQHTHECTLKYMHTFSLSLSLSLSLPFIHFTILPSPTNTISSPISVFLPTTLRIFFLWGSKGGGGGCLRRSALAVFSFLDSGNMLMERSCIQAS